MSLPPPEQSLPHHPRSQQVTSSRIRPCYRDRQASISSQPGFFRAPAPSVTGSLVKRHTLQLYTPRQVTPTPTATPRPAISTKVASNTIERSDIRILTDQFGSFSANQSSLSIVEIGGRSLPLTKKNLSLLLNGYQPRGAHQEEVEDFLIFAGPARDRLLMRILDWQEGVRLASGKTGLENSAFEFRT